MRLVVWNVERKRPSTPTGAAGIERVTREQPEIAVLSEARVGHLPGGYEISPVAPSGERFAPDERKILAWSLQPWRDIDAIGDQRLPGPRFVAGTTSTTIGDVRVIAMCIPWHMCDVRTGSKDCTPWQQHLRWLELFGALIEHRPLPTIIAGDFNQRVPRRAGSRRDVAAALAETFADFQIVTAGVPLGCERQGIDHIAIDDRLHALHVYGWSNDDGGVRMSDHDAAAAELAISYQPGTGLAG